MRASLKEKNIVGRSSHEGREILLNKDARIKCRKLFRIFLALFHVKNYLTFYNIKFSADGDRSQVFLVFFPKTFKEKIRQRILSLKSRNQSEKKLLRGVKVTKGLQRFLSRKLISTFSSCNLFFL